MRTRRFACTLLSALTLFAAAACGESQADPEAVAWTDDVCSALTGFTLAVTQQPDVDREDPVAAVQGLGRYLAATSDALQESIGALAAVGPSPVDGGDEYVARLRDALTRIRASFDGVAAQLATVDTANREALATALPAAVAPLQELHNMPSPAEGLRATGALSTASAAAPNCQQLRTASAPEDAES